MIDRLVEQQVAIYAVLHDAAVSKDHYQHLDLKEDQWVVLEQLTKVLEPLQIATTVFGYEVNTSSSIIYPILHGLIRNHLKIDDKDVPAIKHFKKQVSQDLTQRFQIDEKNIASSIPFLCTVVDPRYSSLKFATSEQRSTAHVAILQHLEEFHQSIMNEECGDRTSDATTKPKSALEILLGDISSKSSVHTPEGEMESFVKEGQGSDTNPLLWWKPTKEGIPTCQSWQRSFCVFQQHRFHLKEYSLCLEQSPVQKEAALNHKMGIC